MAFGVDKLLRKLGVPMTVTSRGEESSVRGIFQQVDSRSWQNLNREFSSVGEVNMGRFLYLGPAEPEISVGDRVKWEGRSYVFRRAERVMLGRKPLYCWGFCLEEGGADTW